MTTKKAAPRGRPRSFDADQALGVAQALFQQRGYDAVGVAEIGKAMGITPPSFYNAFGSKAALFEKVLDRYAADCGSFVADALAIDGPSAGAIEHMLLEAARRYPARDGVAGCLVLDSARNSPDADAAASTRRRKDESRALIVARIAQDRPDRAAEVADIAMIALNGMSASARDGADEAALTGFARATAAAIGQLLVVKPSGRPAIRHP